MITKRQKQALDFITDYQVRKGYAPTLHEIRKKLKLSSVSTAHFHVSKLRDSGYLSKEDNKARSISISSKEPLVKIPLLGTIAAGQPIQPHTDPDATMKIAPSLVSGKKRAFVLQVKGDSMIEEGIFDHDFVLIEECPYIIWTWEHLGQIIFRNLPELVFFSMM